MTNDSPSLTADWQINPALRVHLHARATDGAVLELDDVTGQAMRLHASRSVAELLLQLRDDPLELQRIVARVPAEGSDPVRHFLLEHCVTHRILIQNGQDTHAATQNPRPSYLSAMWELIPARTVNFLAPWLKGLFHPQSIAVLCLLIAAALISMFVAMGAASSSPALISSEILGVGAASAFGILLHELGHAAAAYRFGARRVSIGIGLYLVIPVAYSDLSEIWRCSRGQRIVVNLAGVAMQGMWLGVMMLAHYALGDHVFLVAAGATAVSMLWNLNPFLRMDGYWILADAFDVHDLRARAREELQRVWRRLRTRDRSIQLRPGILIYGVLSAMFLTWLLLRALQFLANVVMTTLPQLYARILDGRIQDMGWADWSLATITVAWKVLIVVVVLRLLLSLPKRLASFFDSTTQVQPPTSRSRAQ
ncbi:MAG: M50 family metallopeptidase [Lysobacteraceae bacterium]